MPFQNNILIKSFDPIEKQKGDHACARRGGGILIPVSIVLVLFSGFLGLWYQNTLKFQLQTQATAGFHSQYQELKSFLPKVLHHWGQLSTNDIPAEPVLLELTSDMDAPWQWHSPNLGTDLILASSHFESHFRTHSVDLSKIPWSVSASHAPITLPTSILLEAPSRTELYQSHSFYFFETPTSVTAFDHVLSDPVVIEVQAEQLLITSEVNASSVFSLPLNQAWSIQAEQSVVFKTTSHSISNFLYLEVNGLFTWKQPEQAAAFPTQTAPLFLYLKEGLVLESSQSHSDANLSIMAHAWIDAEECLQTHEVLESIYWLGSLGCRYGLPADWSPSIVLQSVDHNESTPSVFIRKEMDYQGTRRLDLHE